MKNLHGVGRDACTMQGECKTFGGKWGLGRRLEEDGVACNQRRDNGVHGHEIWVTI